VGQEMRMKWRSEDRNYFEMNRHHLYRVIVYPRHQHFHPAELFSEVVKDFLG
jgi:hypothetical protein